MRTFNLCFSVLIAALGALEAYVLGLGAVANRPVGNIQSLYDLVPNDDTSIAIALGALLFFPVLWWVMWRLERPD